MTVLRYVSHPEVEIDPDVPVPQWSLSERGRERALLGAAQPWVREVSRVISSGEVKAIETAEIYASAAQVDVEVRPLTGEIDRSSTGYVSHERHEALADELFAHPHQSAAGWERAVDATQRMAEALADVLDAVAAPGGSIVVVGHGGVGTLLMCHLAGLDVGRGRDQPHGGCLWTYDTADRRLVNAWQPIDGRSATSPS